MVDPSRGTLCLWLRGAVSLVICMKAGLDWKTVELPIVGSAMQTEWRGRVN
jgi:hypothetical protein